MTDVPPPSWPGSEEVEALVVRAVAARVDPLRTQLETVTRALGILAERVLRPQAIEELNGRIDTLAAHVEELSSLERILRDGLAELGTQLTGRAAAELTEAGAELGERLEGVAGRLEQSVAEEAAARRAQADDLRQVVAAAVEEAVAGVDRARAADTDRLVERMAALEAPLNREAEERRSQTDDLRQALAVAVQHAVAKVEQARAVEVGPLVERIDALTNEVRARQAEAEAFRQTMATALEQAVTWIEAAVTTDTARVLERITALEAPLAADVDARQAGAEELRTAVATTVEQAVARIEATRADEEAKVLEQVAALEGQLARDAVARQAQLDDLRHTVATTIDQAVNRIETGRAGDAARLLEELTALAGRTEADAQRRDQQAAALLEAVDERLQALHMAGAEAGDAREERLAGRLETINAENGKALLVHLDERTAAIKDLESITVRVAAEVQAATAAALTTQVEPLLARLVETCDSLAHEGGRIEAMARAHAGEARAVEERVAALFVEVAERSESAIDHSRARIAEGQVALSTRFDAIMGELLTSVSATADRLEARLTETAEGLRAASGHQNGALLDAVTRSTQQLAEVRSALLASGNESAARVADAERRAQSLVERVDALRATVESMRNDPRLEALVVEQVAAREAQLSAIDAMSRRIDEVGPVVARALLSEVERATRAANAAEEAVASLRPETLRSALGDATDEIRTAAASLDETMAGFADRVEQGLAALDDLRASQTVLREAVQGGTHKAELAALDIRGLRERLTPHLVALVEATTRRAEADQAGFDAVLARLDQLLAAKPR